MGTGPASDARDRNSCFFLFKRRPQRPTRRLTLFPYTTLFRSAGNSRSHHDPPGNPTRSACETRRIAGRSEEHTSELQSPIDSSYAVFCLKQKTSEALHTERSGEETRHVNTQNFY